MDVDYIWMQGRFSKYSDCIKINETIDYINPLIVVYNMVCHDGDRRNEVREHNTYAVEETSFSYENVSIQRVR